MKVDEFFKTVGFGLEYKNFRKSSDKLLKELKRKSESKATRIFVMFGAEEYQRLCLQSIEIPDFAYLTGIPCRSLVEPPG